MTNRTSHEPLHTPGTCAQCDEGYVPTNLRAVRPDGEEVAVSARYGGQTLRGAHEWVVVVPDGPVVEFRADSGLQEGHVLSFVSLQHGDIGRFTAQEGSSS